MTVTDSGNHEEEEERLLEADDDDDDEFSDIPHIEGVLGVDLSSLDTDEPHELIDHDDLEFDEDDEAD